ncbi:polymorphic toxin-type HINT domain-containing protein [Dactylosporangium sp. AC04546]|uniref:polymorphic toxin-type HINT domain-containing protein n=1 Tax=Dactylosporangium sp. AC04546 TaxID=2862460 RepID=UPI001EE0AF27|nr:polymorphic toxin-type HINT domain-containing protein [Dactylosporangium sp. AC04546]WVK79886.1 polymorphic toxin-type HINT domain-containing protein [Dactylosporangium sp. AC04546]
MFSRVLIRFGSSHRRATRLAAFGTTLVVASNVLVLATAPAQAAPGRGRPGVQAGETVKGHNGTVQPKGDNPAAAAAVKGPATAGWPKAGVVDVPVTGKAAAATSTVVGGLAVGAHDPAVPVVPKAERGQALDHDVHAHAVPAKVRVEVMERSVSSAARVDGPVFKIRRADAGGGVGRVGVSFSYKDFADAYGGDFGSRLRLVRLPDCALSTPELAGCTAATPIPTVNDTAADVLRADIDASAATSGGVFAMTAGESSSQGSYGATTLAPSSTWNVAPSSGVFNWSYPLRTPPVPGGQGPQVTLGYSSQSVDGRTAATNNQGSWIGEGFSYESGYIERRYKACAQDGHETSADMCWSHDNATIMLNGSSGELIKDASGRWRMTSDQDWKIEKLTGAVNGDDNGEHWKITVPDGTEYYFGLNRLFGWVANNEETNSVWTLPVFGDDLNEPCYNSTFDNAACDQAWRWNLDYSRDLHDNVTSYYYGREDNWYAKNGKTDVNGTKYAAGGYLKHIDYGERHNAVYTTNAPARVWFDVAERCLPAGSVDCDPQDLNATTAPSWPDVPFDRICAENTKCKADQAAPSFFTRKRLTKVTTQIRGATDWVPVDSWTLDHWFTDNADGSRSLWLNKITHKGHVGGEETMPAVELVGRLMPNRIDRPDDNIAQLNRWRVAAVYTDSGAQVTINYAPADCAAGSLPQPGASTKRCYPVQWNPSNGDPVTDWFHKYVVAEVIETDRTTQADEMVTRYDYQGDAAWRKAEPDGFTEAKYLTWAQWRGYGKVAVTRGNGQTMTTKTEHTYFRGLHGNPLPAGGTLNATVTDSTGGVHTDLDDFSGQELETTVYDGANVVSKSIALPWRYETGAQTFDWGTVRSTYVKPGVTRSFTALGGGAWRETKMVNTYETTHGRLVTADDLGDVSTAADDQCARTEYADNATKWIYALPRRAETVSVNCDTTPNRAKHVISDSRSWYDGLAYGAAPTKGDATKTEKLATHDGTTAAYVTVADTTYDQWGRPLTVKDAKGTTTTTAYTHTFGLTTKKEEIGPISTAWKTTTEYAPAWGQPTAQIDPNGKRGDMVYDPLGRLTQVWLPDRSKSGGATASIKYTYLMRTNAPVAVKTEKVRNDGTYGVQYALYDGHLRPRQVQGEGPEGGRLVADTFYTATGQVKKTYATYHAAGAPSDQLLVVNNGDVDGQTWFEYDGADRPIAEIVAVAGDEKWRTTTTYGGDRTHVDPPNGGVASTAITDARGNTTALRRYKGGSPSGAYEETTYTFTAAGQMATLTDPVGNVWSWEYDQRGRQTVTKDPDAGTTTTTYDDLDRPETITDARNNLLTTVYDKIGRKTAVYSGTVATGTKLAAWTYDSLYKGQLYSATRYVDGKAYGMFYTNLDDAYRVKSTTYVIPSVPGNEELAGQYTFTTTYNRDGSVQGNGLPEAGGLPAEALVYSYDDLQRPTTLTGSSSYVTDSKYAQTGELLQLQLGTSPKKAWLTWEYEEGTKRLASTRLDREGAPAVDIHARYSYDNAGNVLSIKDTPAGGQRDIQCFEYDWSRRMTRGWATASTAADECAGGPAVTGVSGPAPYHHSYEYDVTGGRSKETIHGVGGATDVTRDYQYPTGTARGHDLSGVVEHTSGGDRLYTYKYDNAGNTIERDQVGVKQALEWDVEGRLASVTQGTQVTAKYVYDAEGGRLLRKEPNATTLYLPGLELKLDHASKVVRGTRFYTFAGQTVAVRDTSGVKFLSSDHQGTQGAVVDAVTGAITRRRTTPFGAPRGGVSPAWPGDKGFVGGTQDTTTGLTHLGAREFDPALGRFISPDPVFVPDDPTQFNAYQYGRNNPVTYSDPTGLRIPDDDAMAMRAAGYDRNGNPLPKPPAGKPARPAEDPALAEARRKAEEAKQKLINAAKALGKIAMDELGITAALDCLTTGDLGACGETILNVASSFVGGLAGKLASKYGAPWKWKKAYDLGQKVWNLGKELYEGVSTWFKNIKLVKKLSAKADDLAGAACAIPNSFTPGTLVLLAVGGAKAIEEVDVGDVVLATDPGTGRTEPKTVVATIIGHGTKHLVELTVDVDGDRGSQTAAVTATDNHPFWAPELGQWVVAGGLRPGLQLQTATGDPVRVVEIRSWTETATVYNLSVADIHTYYALAGDTPVLVHNDDVTPKWARDEIARIKAGQGTKRLENDNATQKLYQGKESAKHARKWGPDPEKNFAGSPEWEVRNKDDMYRIVGPNSREEYGYTSSKYARIDVATGC